MGSIELYPCRECSLPNCNGQRHFNKSEYIYPTCDICGLELLDLLELIEYPELRNPNECEVCEEQFTEPDQTQSHFNLLEHFQYVNIAQNKFYCLQCDSNCSEDDSTNDNEPTVSTKDIQVWQTMKHKIVRQQPDKSKCWTKVFACRICDSFKSNERNVRNSHEIAKHQHPEKKTFVCPDCGKNQTTVYKLQSHMMQHRPERKPFLCIDCGKDFAERAQLKSHSLTHTTERPFKCNRCEKAYKTSIKLKLHQRSVHEGFRPYACDQCMATFKECSDLRRHRRVHGGVDKSHQCEVCFKRFYELRSLRVHMRSHLCRL